MSMNNGHVCYNLLESIFFKVRSNKIGGNHFLGPFSLFCRKLLGCLCTRSCMFELIGEEYINCPQMG